jgi:alpha/beta superfamily hydrolase
MSVRNLFPFYFGPENRRIFGWYHPAAAEWSNGVGVVLCNPIGDDYIRAHRTFRHIAENLSAAGFPVLRFDFNGTGDSMGTEEDPERINSWLDDIDLAIEALGKLSETRTFALAGLRFGATLAAAAAQKREDIQSLILWSPYLNGQDLVSDSVRVHKMNQALKPQFDAMDHPDPNLPDEEGRGFALAYSTITDLEKIDLLKLKKRPAKSILITGAGRTRSEQERLSEYLVTLGSEVDIRTSPESDRFLFVFNHDASVPEGQVDCVTEWMKTHSGRKADAGKDSGPLRNNKDAPTITGIGR